MNMLELYEDFIQKANMLNVAVIGETIIDEFIEVDYEGKSMKSNCSVLKLKDLSQKQIGGAGVIARHLKDFVKSVDLITNNNEEIVKTRYINQFSREKYIEINKFETDSFSHIDIENNKYDVIIIADFGHGFCDSININEPFHLMCQTNSNNFGYNRVSKWKDFKKKTITIDMRE